MQLNQLKCFAMAAQIGSLTKAAQHMYVTQSAMSQAISQLEKELGVELFKNKGRNIELTSIGRKILFNAQMVIDECNLIKHECDMQKNGEEVVTISAPALPIIIGKLVFDFYHANHNISVVQMPSGDDRSEITIGTTIEEHFSDKRVCIATEEIGLVVPSDHELYGNESVMLEELAGYRIVSLEKGHDQNMQRIEDFFCQQAGFIPKREKEMSSLLDLQEMVFSDRGVVFYPFKFWSIETVHRNRIIRIKNPRCYRYIYVEKKLFPTSNEKAVTAFFDFVISYFRNK